MIEGNHDFVENLLYILSNLGDDLINKEILREKRFKEFCF